MGTARTPTTSASTAEDLFNLPDDARSRFELFRGELVEMTPVGGMHGAIAIRIAARLSAYVEPGNLGVVVAETGFILSRNPDTVRAPDVAFVARDRVDPGGIPDAYWPLAPDLAIEVVSPSDRPDEVQRKVLDYVHSGTRMVWVVYPRTRSITVWRSLEAIRTLLDSAVISGEDVLPGFSCPVAEFFG